MANLVKETLKKYGFKNLEQVKQVCQNANINVEEIVKGIQPIAFDDAVMAYELGCAIALQSKKTSAEETAKLIGEGLQAYCKLGSVADERQIGLGHGNLASILLSEKTNCFCFLAGHESFAAAEGAMGIARTANKVRKNPLKVILNGLGKDAAYIIARINGFTYVDTYYDHEKHTLQVRGEKCFGTGERANVKVYGAYDTYEGVEIMKLEKVDVSITGNSTNPVRFQHPVAGAYKKWCYENGRTYFSVASGGGTGRTLHPDNVGAGPASYGLTDTLGRMHCDAQFAGSSSVPAHVEMMGFIGMGNNPIVGATVALAVSCALANKF
ncbi:MAG: GGGtGRT protein [Clostridiales bacterium]|nr:GGGtGRT protein [Clostridiales bacterium]